MQNAEEIYDTEINLILITAILKNGGIINTVLMSDYYSSIESQE